MPYQKEKNARGLTTRERLIATALALFGTHGFQGVGAREITAAAGVPLSAIPYHFETKEALYLAVVARVCDELAQAMGPAVEAAIKALEGDAPHAAGALVNFQAALLEVMAVRPEASSWAKLLMREHLDPGPGYPLIYENAGRQAVEITAALIAKASSRHTDDEQVLIEAFARVGQVLAFRTLQPAILRRLGWARFGPREAASAQSALARMA